MTGELLKNMTKLEMNHIPFKGAAPAINDLVGGHVPMLIDSTIAVVPMIKSGKAKAIAVTGKQRASQLPDVPTVEESGVKDLKGFESYAWYGLFAPANTPADVVSKLEKASLEYMHSAEFKHVLESSSSQYVGSDSAAFAAFINEDAKRWAKIAPTLNLTLD